MPLNIPNDANYYYSETFKTLIRSQKDYLIKTAAPIALKSKSLKYIFNMDFYSLLRYHQIKTELWWATAYINDITNPFQDISDVDIIYVLNEEILNGIISRNNTVKG